MKKIERYKKAIMEHFGLPYNQVMEESGFDDQFYIYFGPKDKVDKLGVALADKIEIVTEKTIPYGWTKKDYNKMVNKNYFFRWL